MLNKHRLFYYLRGFIFLLIALTSLTIGTTAHAEIRDLPVITVLAPSGLHTAISVLARNYSSEGDITVSVAYGPSRAHLRDIIQGEEADLIIVDDSELTDQLKLRGLIDIYSRTRLAEDFLVLIRAADPESPQARRHITPLNARQLLSWLNNYDIMLPSPKLTPAGSYVEKALSALSLNTDRSTITFFVDNAQDVVTQVLRNDNTIGITYLRNVISRNDISILGTVPLGNNSPISYEAAVVAGKNMPEARNFLEYIKSDKASAMLLLPDDLFADMESKNK